MKRFFTATAVCLAFAFAVTISALAQDEHREEKKEARQEERHDAHAERRRIADEHWRAHFGHEHHFAVRHVTVVGGERRFVYGGYTFGFAEPWPAGWAYSDDVYIDDIDGQYFLFNTRHPGVRIAVNVVP